MEGILPAHQVECGDQSEQPKGMITMKVAYEDMMYLSHADPEFPQLHLGSFSAVN
jgi:hypothetical protein